MTGRRERKWEAPGGGESPRSVGVGRAGARRARAAPRASLASSAARAPAGALAGYARRAAQARGPHLRGVRGAGEEAACLEKVIERDRGTDIRPAIRAVRARRRARRRRARACACLRGRFALPVPVREVSRRDETCPVSTGEGRDVSGQYGRGDEPCPVSPGGRGGGGVPVREVSARWHREDALGLRGARLRVIRAARPGRGPPAFGGVGGGRRLGARLGHQPLLGVIHRASSRIRAPAPGAAFARARVRRGADAWPSGPRALGAGGRAGGRVGGGRGAGGSKTPVRLARRAQPGGAGSRATSPCGERPAAWRSAARRRAPASSPRAPPPAPGARARARGTRPAAGARSRSTAQSPGSAAASRPGPYPRACGPPAGGRAPSGAPRRRRTET
jgi:hypothetical protein